MEEQETQQQEKFIKMTQTPVPRLICGLAAPCILSMLITSFYNMADTYFVSRIGTSATAAVGVVFSLMAVIQALGFTFGHGSGNYISRQLGKHQTEDASIMAATGFFSAVLAGCIITVLGLAFLRPLVRELGATETIEPYAVDYAWYILLGAPFMMGSLVLNNQLRFQGSPASGMIGMCSGGILNIALDPLFIFGFHMGIKGAAAATMVSQAVSFIILFVMCRRGGNIPVYFRNFKPSLARYKEIIRGGVPSLARQGIASVATIFLNRAAGIYGDAAIAAMSIVMRVTNFAGSALIGFGQGFQPVCGFNYGAKLYGRVLSAFWFCVKSSTGFLILIAALGFVFAPQIIGMFRDDPDVIAVGTVVLRLQCITFPTFSWTTMSNMMLQTMGKAVRATILSLSRQGLFFIPAIWILSELMGLRGLELCQSAADIGSLVLAVPMAARVLRDFKRKTERQTETADESKVRCA